MKQTLCKIECFILISFGRLPTLGNHLAFIPTSCGFEFYEILHSLSFSLQRFSTGYFEHGGISLIVTLGGSFVEYDVNWCCEWERPFVC